MIETLRLSERGKSQLTKLRRSNAIKHWNALCRWALCTSLADPRPVGGARLVADSNIEISWKVLTGDLGDVYLALLEQRAQLDEVGLAPKDLSMLLRRHVHRGIELLAGDKPPTIIELCESACKNNISSSMVEPSRTPAHSL